MNFRNLLVFLFAALTVMASVSALSVNESTFQASIKGIDVVEGSQVTVYAGETIPIKVVFESTDSDDLVKVKAEITGLRDDVEVTTDRFDVRAGKLNSVLLSLKIPTDVELEENAQLIIRIGSFDATYDLDVQRESFNIDMISVEADSTVVAGNNLNLDIVAKNRGSHELSDLFVIARIPALNVEKKVFFGDLDQTDDRYVVKDNYIIVKDSNRDDTAEKLVSLVVPGNAKPGVYTLEVTAYNSDVTEKISKNFVVLESDAKSEVFTAVASKDTGVNQEVVFDLVLVNKGSGSKVYEITPEVSGSLNVFVEEPIVSISGDSSKVVKIRVTPGKDGTYTFGVNVNSDNELVKRVSLTVNATGQVLNNSVVVLTVVLAIIFVVLLVVLIVLLTRKPSKEAEESYY